MNPNQIKEITNKITLLTLCDWERIARQNEQKFLHFCMDFYQGQDWKIEKILWSSGQMEFVYRNTFDMPQNRIVPMAKWLFFIKKIKKENKNKISG